MEDAGESQASGAASEPSAASFLPAARRRRAEIIEVIGLSLTARRDPTDVLALADAFVDVITRIERARATIETVHPTSSPEAIADQARILVLATRHLADAVTALVAARPVSPHRSQVRALERDGDQIVRDGVATLFQSGAPPTEVVRAKEILDAAEAAIDAVRAASDVVAQVAVNSGG